MNTDGQDEPAMKRARLEGDDAVAATAESHDMAVDTAVATDAAVAADTADASDAADASASSSAPQGSDVINSEFFKIRIGNMHKYLNPAGLKKLLTDLGLTPTKIKKSPSWEFAYVCFPDDAARQLAISKINGHIYKHRPLEATLADPNTVRARPARDAPQEDPSLSPAERLANQVTPWWNVPYEEQLERKRKTMAGVVKGALRKAGLPANAVELKETVPSPTTTGYRNKCEFSFGYGPDEKVTLGFQLGLFREGFSTVQVREKEGKGKAKDGNVTFVLWFSLF